MLETCLLWTEPVLCSECNLWIHQKRASLTHFQYAILEDNTEETWYCRVCKGNMLPLQSLTNN